MVFGEVVVLRNIEHVAADGVLAVSGHISDLAAPGELVDVRDGRRAQLVGLGTRDAARDLDARIDLRGGGGSGRGRLFHGRRGLRLRRKGHRGIRQTQQQYGDSDEHGTCPAKRDFNVSVWTRV